MPKKKAKTAPVAPALSVAPPAGTPADVTLNLVSFNPWRTGLECGLLPAEPLTISNPGKKIDYMGGQPGSNGIVVLKQNVKISFALNLSSMEEFYSLAGMSLVQQNSGIGSPDPVGGTNFSLDSWKKTQLLLTAKGVNGKAKWKLFVYILNEKKELGIIDPEIENDANPAI